MVSSVKHLNNACINLFLPQIDCELVHIEVFNYYLKMNVHELQLRSLSYWVYLFRWKKNQFQISNENCNALDTERKRQNWPWVVSREYEVRFAARFRDFFGHKIDLWQILCQGYPNKLILQFPLMQ